MKKMVLTEDTQKALEIRKRNLKEMDEYIRSNVEKEICEKAWFVNGLPQNWDEEVLTKYALDSALYNKCTEVFEKCLGIDDDEDDEDY